MNADFDSMIGRVCFRLGGTDEASCSEAEASPGAW